MVSVVKTFTVTVPRKDSVRCAIYKIVNCENDPMASSKFCKNKLKCRQFLEKTPQAIAAPVVNRKIREAGGFMYVIVGKELSECCAFQNHCGALNIQMMDLLDPVPIYIYRSCLLYTVEYRLAPQWNKVGLYLVEGQGFLGSTGSVNAIMLKIKEIYDSNAVLHISAVNLKIPFLRLNMTRTLQDDLQPPVRVLPSMKMANVLRVSKIIKSQHVFDDYEKLRAYWRNMHGYVLPDYEEGSLFYDIEFFYFKSCVFLYPETCLASGPLEVLPPPMDPVSRIYKFTEELRERVTQLCGQQLDICPESTYQLPAVTPIPSRFNRFATCDTGYGTESERIKSTARFRTPDTCEIPAKRSRMPLPRASQSLTCGIEVDDYDFGISPMCSANEFKSPKTPSNISSILYRADSTVPVVEENERKSSYFTQEEQETEVYLKPDQV
ncbi:hypothetical protein X777_01248 [Ooceraea biroi]|uniref:DUF4708 domain-containing protein n=1 Tax=Ooceraea biroi TaxID=2015173 RepID=A0A026WRH5_OOCBI|nr:hypothetical protein X777_01248 [Ooceraea biroi]